MANDHLNYYEILQVTPHAAPEVIKAAHRALSKTMHPDAGGSTALAVAINEAIDVLSDPAKRQRYDMEIRIGKAKTFGAGEERITLREVYLVVCLACRVKNRLRDENLVGVRCSGCGQQFQVAEPSPTYQHSETSVPPSVLHERRKQSRRFISIAIFSMVALLSCVLLLLLNVRL